MSGFEAIETAERIERIAPDLTTRFKWRAEKRARKLNSQRPVPFFRWEVVPVRATGWYSVVAFQNVAKAPEESVKLLEPGA